MSTKGWSSVLSFEFLFVEEFCPSDYLEGLPFLLLFADKPTLVFLLQTHFAAKSCLNLFAVFESAETNTIKSALAPDSKSSYLLPVYTAEKRVSLDISEARLNLASQPFLRILLGPRQLVTSGNQKRSNRISQQCESIPDNLTSITGMLIIWMILLYIFYISDVTQV